MKHGALQRAGFLLLLIGTWAAVSSAGIVPPWALPTPWEVVGTLVSGVADLSLVFAVGTSLWRLLLGYTISVVGGVATGLLLARSQLVHQTLGSVVVGLQALPSIAWLPLALLWFGLSEAAIVFVVVLGSWLAVTIAAEDAVRGVPPLMLRAARTMGAGGPTLYLKVVLPAALPGIVTGMKLGWSFAWRSLMAAELLFISGGLGQQLHLGRELHDMSLVIAVMLLVVAVGLAVDQLVFGTMETRVRARWGLDRA
jgi:NitT/TauT family transport system permease protein